jgi:hypothetical protein
MEMFYGLAAEAGIPIETDEYGGVMTVLTPEQKNQLDAIGAPLGIRVFAPKSQREDTGTWWKGPFDNKMVDEYPVAQISYVGVQDGQQAGGQGGSKTATPLAQELDGLLQRSGGVPKPEGKSGEAQAATTKPQVKPKTDNERPLVAKQQRAEPASSGRGKSIEQWMAENPDLASQPGILAIINLDISEDEKKRRIDRKIQQMRKSFVRKPPMMQ